MGLSAVRHQEDQGVEWVRSAAGPTTIVTGIHVTPFGLCWLASSDIGIHGLGFVGRADPAGHGLTGLEAQLTRRWPRARRIRDDVASAVCFRTIDRWSAQGRDTRLPVAVSGTAFQDTVWRLLLTIPRGRTVTYGDLAAAAGFARASRAVGSAVGRNPIPWVIPCHRVVRADGQWEHYRWGASVKQALLASEAADAAPPLRKTATRVTLVR